MQIMFVWSLQLIILSVLKEHSDEYDDVISKQSEVVGAIVEARDDWNGEIGMMVEARDDWENLSMAQVQSLVGDLKIDTK